MLSLYPTSWIGTEERILTTDNFDFARMNESREEKALKQRLYLCLKMKV